MVSNSNATIERYTGTDENVIIPDMLGGYPVKTIDSSAFYGCTFLLSISIPDNVTTIVGDAFQDLIRLTSITIPSSVTTIGGRAFKGCTGLKSVNFNAINCTTMGSSDYPVFTNCNALNTINIGTGVTNIPAYAFYNCTGLTSITIPNSVTTIGGYAFYGCTSLTSATMGTCVTTIGESAFSDCTNLADVNYNPINCTSMGNSRYPVFYNCNTLTTVNIGTGVTNIPAYAFYKYTGLKSIIIPTSVTTIGGYAFSDCTGLKSIIIPTSVTTIDNAAFQNCTGLTGITIPNSIMTISNSMFSSCTGLTGITIPNSVTKIGSSAFQSCTGLTSITIPSSVTTIDNAAFQNCTGLTDITIPNSIMTISSSTFSSCTGLTGITIPNSVTQIGSSAFSGCTKLAIVNFNPINCISMGSKIFPVFYKCSALTTVNIGTSVTNIPAYAFYGCTGLTGITIPNSVATIGESVFLGCTKLETVNFNPNNCISMGNYSSPVFFNCSALTTVNIGTSVTNIPSYAFYKCTELTSITITKSVTTIGGYAFDDTSWYNSRPNGLVYIGNVIYKYKGIMPPNTKIALKSDTSSISDSAFSGCTGLTSITLPNSVTLVGDNAFYGCTGLTSATIGKSVLTIGQSAFYNTNIHSIIIPESVMSIGSEAFFPGMTVIAYLLGDAPSLGAGAFPANCKIYYLSYKKGFSNQWNGYTTFKLPLPPISVKAESASYNSIKISWTTSIGTTGYFVYRYNKTTDTYDIIKTTNATSYTDTSLINGNTYYYKVKAYVCYNSKYDYSGFSASAGCKTVLQVPANAKAISLTYTSVKVSWSPSSGITGYIVYRYNASKKTYEQVKTTTATSYTETSLITGKVYSYKIKAYKIVGSKKYYSAYTAVLSITPVPAMPGSFTVVKASSTSITLKWNAVAGATGYEVYRYSTATGKYTLFKTVITTTYANTGLATNKTYSYKVRAYRTVNGVKVFGALTAAKSVST
jgi:fibronectin type 3 domain-containing protein